MNLLSPDALYAGFLGALFGTGVESVDAVVKGLPVDFELIDSTTDASEYDAFADILNEPEDIENFTEETEHVEETEGESADELEPEAEVVKTQTKSTEEDSDEGAEALPDDEIEEVSEDSEQPPEEETQEPTEQTEESQTETTVEVTEEAEKKD